jgi:hypothetical protein
LVYGIIMSGLRLFNEVYNNENILYESLITEALEIHSADFYYIPRTFVAKDEILGEDRLSKFKNAYPIPMYMETTNGFEGQGAFISKFGLTMEQQATLSVARRSWEAAVGRFGESILPQRPAEGDLLYFPLSGGLFEIMFVQHQNPFYQLGQLYVFRLTVELFRYASETMETGVAAIDAFNSLSLRGYDGSAGYLGSAGYMGSGGYLGSGTGYIGSVNTDIPQSYGDNKKFKSKKDEFFFNENNPFGNL